MRIRIKTSESRHLLHLAGRLLAILSVIAMLAPVNAQVEIKRSACKVDAGANRCCCSEKAAKSKPNSEMQCCCRGGNSAKTEQSTDSKPAKRDNGCPCGNCNCRVVISVSPVMPFLHAPAYFASANHPLLNSLPVPSMDLTGDACVQGVFHPPRC